MGQPFVGEIRMAGFNFPPVGWLLCDGSLQSIANNETLFTLIGTTYGGDGQIMFALPDLRSRVPIHQGTGQSSYVIGQNGGVESVALPLTQIAQHSHSVPSTGAGQQLAPAANTIMADAVSTVSAANVYGPGATPVALSAAAIGTAGGGQPHSNIQPVLCINFIISQFGIFPSQN